MEYHSGGSLPLLGRPRYCPGANANGGYLCETGHCCGETGCCTYYYELWWFWLLWTVLILFSCCCAYRHRRAKLRVQQQQRQREISLLAYHGANSYPSSMLDLSFLASLKLPSYEEVAAQPSTPPPPYSSVFTTPRYPQPPRAADPHLLTQHGPLLHRPLSDGPSSLSSDNSSSCSCDSCCPSSPCSSSLSAPVTYETDTSHATTPSEATPLTLDVTMETIAAAASCLEVNEAQFVSERKLTTVDIGTADENSAGAQEHIATDSAVTNQIVSMGVVTRAVSPHSLPSPSSEVALPIVTTSPVKQQLGLIPCTSIVNTCSSGTLPSPSVIDTTLPSIQIISIEGPVGLETIPASEITSKSGPSTPTTSNHGNPAATLTLDITRTFDTANVSRSPTSVPCPDVGRTLALITSSAGLSIPDPNPSLVPITAVPTNPTQASIPVPTNPTQASIQLPTNPTQASIPVPTNPTQASIQLPTNPTQASIQLPTNPTQASIPVPTNPTQASIQLPTNPTQASIPVPTNPTQASIQLPTNPTQASIQLPTNPTQASIPVPTNPTQASIPVPTNPTQASIPVPTNPTQASIPVPTNPTQASIQLPTNPTQASIQLPTNPTQVSIQVHTNLSQSLDGVPTDLTQDPNQVSSNLTLATEAAPISHTLAHCQIPENLPASCLALDPTSPRSSFPQHTGVVAGLVSCLDPAAVPVDSGPSLVLSQSSKSDLISPLPSNIQEGFSSGSGSCSSVDSGSGPPVPVLTTSTRAASSSSNSCPAITIESESSFALSQSPPAALSPSIPSPPSRHSLPALSPISLPAPALLLDPLTALHQSNKSGSSSGHASSLSPSPRATQSPPKQTLFSPCVDVFEPGPPSWEDEEEQQEQDDDEDDMGADESQYRHRRLTGDSGIEVCRCRVEEEEEEEEGEEKEEEKRKEISRRGGGGVERDKKVGGNTDLHDSVDCPARGQITTGEGLTLCNSTSTTSPASEDGGKVLIVMETV